MRKLPIIMNAADHEELSCAIDMLGKLSERGHAMSSLRDELSRAEIVSPNNTPADVITMNSRAEVLDLDTGERMKLAVVFPRDADIEQGKISVLAPQNPGHCISARSGARVCGLSLGDECDVTRP
jgi:regulator of nucleoside diphosphate kinase